MSDDNANNFKDFLFFGTYKECGGSVLIEKSNYNSKPLVFFRTGFSAFYIVPVNVIVFGLVFTHIKFLDILVHLNMNCLQEEHYFKIYFNILKRKNYETGKERS